MSALTAMLLCAESVSVLAVAQTTSELTLILPSLPLSAAEVVGVLLPSVVMVTSALPRALTSVLARVASMVMLTGSISQWPAWIDAPG